MELPVLSCEGCGACCYLQSLPPYMPTELDVLAKHLVAEISAAMKRNHKGPCIWLNAEKRCGHYEERPEVCRQFELGGEECVTLRREFLKDRVNR